MKRILLPVFAVLVIVGIVLAAILIIPSLTPTLESKARTSGHIVALCVKSGRFHSREDIYTGCCVRAQENGYQGEEFNRFVNIAFQQAYYELP